jgi:hypothetical protein
MPQKRWTREEDAKLLLLAPKFNNQWSLIVKYFDDRTDQEISSHWHKVLRPDLVKGGFTREEDEIIIHYAMAHGGKSWEQLAQVLPQRSSKQCRERWRNRLDPSVNRTPWTPAEDQMISALYQQFGSKWVQIARFLPGRTDDMVKNRWNWFLTKKNERGGPRPPPFATGGPPPFLFAQIYIPGNGLCSDPEVAPSPSPLNK